MHVVDRDRDRDRNSELTMMTTSEFGKTAEVVNALLEYFVDPMLPLRPPAANAPPPLRPQHHKVAKQLHAVVILYNYYHRKLHPDAKFLDVVSFIKLALTLKPSLVAYTKTINSKGVANHLSDMEKVITHGCKICVTLEVARDVPDMEGWTISNVGVLLVDSSKEKCFLQYNCKTEGVWSVIEKAVDEEEVNRLIKGKLRDRDESTSEKDIAEFALQQFAFLAVKTETGINSSDLTILERHITYSLTKRRSSNCFYIMQCNQPTDQHIQIPVRNTIQSLQCPLVKRYFGGWMTTDPPEYYHLLPYAKIMSNWYSREFSTMKARSVEASTMENMDVTIIYESEKLVVKLLEKTILKEGDSGIEMSKSSENSSKCEKINESQDFVPSNGEEGSGVEITKKTKREVGTSEESRSYEGKKDELHDSQSVNIEVPSAYESDSQISEKTLCSQGLKEDVNGSGSQMAEANEKSPICCQVAISSDKQVENREKSDVLMDVQSTETALFDEINRDGASTNSIGKGEIVVNSFPRTDKEREKFTKSCDVKEKSCEKDVTESKSAQDFCVETENLEVEESNEYNHITKDPCGNEARTKEVDNREESNERLKIADITSVKTDSSMQKDLRGIEEVENKEVSEERPIEGLTREESSGMKIDFAMQKDVNCPMIFKTDEDTQACVGSATVESKERVPGMEVDRDRISTDSNTLRIYHLHKRSLNDNVTQASDEETYLTEEAIKVLYQKRQKLCDEKQELESQYASCEKGIQRILDGNKDTISPINVRESHHEQGGGSGSNQSLKPTSVWNKRKRKSLKPRRLAELVLIEQSKNRERVPFVEVDRDGISTDSITKRASDEQGPCQNEVENKEDSNVTSNTLRVYQKTRSKDSVTQASVEQTGGSDSIQSLEPTSFWNKSKRKSLKPRKLSELVMQKHDDDDDCALFFPMDEDLQASVQSVIVEGKEKVPFMEVDKDGISTDSIGKRAHDEQGPYQNEAEKKENSTLRVYQKRRSKDSVTQASLEGANVEETNLTEVKSSLSEIAQAQFNQQQGGGSASTQSLRPESLSEAVLIEQSARQKELNDMCYENDWALPRYVVSAAPGGFLAKVTLKGVDFEAFGEGVVCLGPCEARESAAAKLVATLLAMAGNPHM